MLYALNVFSLVAGKEAAYRNYSVKAGKIIYRLGGRVVASGHQPIRHLRGDVQRQEFIVVEFPSAAVFQQFHDAAESEGLHSLREGCTRDYVWTLYQPWDLRTWVKE